MYIKYVVGFLFNDDLTEVLLINKTKPKWQNGKLNGVGGKIEKDETKVEAMVREFQEETSVSSDSKDWHLFCSLTEFQNSRDLHSVFCLRAVSNFHDLSNLDIKQTTEEKPEVFKVSEVSMSDRILPNLKWLIPLAIDSIRTKNGPKSVEAHYGDVNYD